MITEVFKESTWVWGEEGDSMVKRPMHTPENRREIKMLIEQFAKDDEHVSYLVMPILPLFTQKSDVKIT